MKLFLDTNIIIDLLADRAPFSFWAQRIFKDQSMGIHELYTSANSILTAFNIVEQKLGDQKAKTAISIILSRVEIMPISKTILISAFSREFKDFEDAVQHECAFSIDHLDCIVTRNKRDFKKSLVPVMSSEELYN
jgi:predicted nucleic acid-binding protein